MKMTAETYAGQIVNEYTTRLEERVNERYLSKLKEKMENTENPYSLDRYRAEKDTWMTALVEANNIACEILNEISDNLLYDFDKMMKKENGQCEKKM